MAKILKTQKTVKLKVKKDEKKPKTSEVSVLTIDILDIKGKKKDTMDLPKDLFGLPENNALIAQAVRIYLSNQRQASAIAQTRGEVSGSRKKIYRQKGTGRARHGDKYAGIFVGGGKAHGPRLRSFAKDFNKKMKRKALGVALSSQLRENHILIVDGIEKIEPKSKVLFKILTTLTDIPKNNKLKEKVLIATPGKVDSVYKAGKNIKNLTIREAQLLTTYEVVNNNRLIFSKEAITALGRVH